MPQPKKPTGMIQRAIFKPSSLTVQKITFPDTKEGIELLIANSYSNCANTAGVSVDIVKQNDTSDLDFNANFEGKEVYLELTEIALLGRGGYKSASTSYEILPFAVKVAEQIRKKAEKYMGVTKTPIILLLYSTDWRFSVVSQALEYLQFMMHDGRHGLARIELISFSGDGTACLDSIYPPHRKEWSDYDATHIVNKGVVFADVSKPLPRSEWPGEKKNVET
jgi:hypothetical protein